MPRTRAPSVTVRDIMSKEPICADAFTTLSQLVRLLDENEISGVPVVGPSGEVIGVVSKTDLLRHCIHGGEPGVARALLDLFAETDALEETLDQPAAQAGIEADEVTVDEFMSTDPITATPDEPLGAVARRMSDAGVHRVIVVDGERCPIGIVTSLDLLRTFPQ